MQILGEAGDGVTALKMVEELNPRVVFTDIEMPEKNGVDLAREIYDINPQTILIFATAHANYTHQAFEVYAFDYLLKPFDFDRIKETLEKIKKMESQRIPVPNYFHRPVTGQITPSRLVIKQNDKLIVLDTKEIIFITRENRKTVICTAKHKLESMENLDVLEKMLTGKSFFRSHRGYLVNLALIKEIYPWWRKGYYITFAGTKQTALLTAEKLKELEKILI